MGGLMLSAIFSGRLVSRIGKYKAIMVAGVAITFAGIFLLSRMQAGTTRIDLAWRMLVLGIGLGPSQSLFNLAAQNALPPQQLGVVTASSQFFRQIGATVGVALFGTFLTNHLNQALGRIMPGMDVGALRGLGVSGVTPVLPEFVRRIIATAITDTFTLALYVVALAGVAVLLVPHLPLRDRQATLAPRPQRTEAVL
jgi:MFS family permease